MQACMILDLNSSQLRQGNIPLSLSSCLGTVACASSGLSIYWMWDS
ncbi:hypothetical protein M3J09_005170 [Ascochyta lentis]